MKSMIGRLGLLVLLITPIVIAAAMPSNTEVSAATVSAGGGKASSNYFTATVTVGQATVGRGASSAHQFRLGFWEAILPRIPNSVDDVVNAYPDRLLDCAPNPFNPATTIRFSLNTAAHVRINLYDLRGRLVERLLDESREPGFHTLDYRPRRLASGVYLMEMRAGSFRDVRRMVLLK